MIQDKAEQPKDVTVETPNPKAFDIIVFDQHSLMARVARIAT
jgi:hypothetical protein